MLLSFYTQKNILFIFIRGQDEYNIEKAIKESFEILNRGEYFFDINIDFMEKDKPIIESDMMEYNIKSEGGKNDIKLNNIKPYLLL